MHKVAGRFFRNREDVEDIVQESLFAAYRHRHKFEGRAKPLTWLHSIVVNRALMELRSRKLRHAVSLDEITVAGKPLSSFLAASDSFSNVEATHHRTEQHRLLRETIDQIPKSYRSVLRTYYLEEMDIREGAECWEYPVRPSNHGCFADGEHWLNCEAKRRKTGSDTASRLA